MSRREEQQTEHEALQEVTSRPGRQRPHESAMASFVAGIMYEESRHEHEHDIDDQKTRHDHSPKPE